MSGRWQAEKEAVVNAGREMAAKGLVVGTAGNVSVRLGCAGEELLAITPSRKPYHELAADDIQVIDFEADPVEGEQVPSVESLMHIAAYRRRPDVRAVIHTHSVYATVLAVARMELPPLIDEMVTSIGGEVRVTEYAFPSTEELAENAAAGLDGRNAVLLANHGVVGVGTDLRQALTVCELVERAAQVYVLARAIGRVNLLPDDVVATEKELFKMMHLAESR
ncbi:MAG: class II aldolase/adducin family protein [Dehalococcoidia bacterium]